VRLVQHHPIAMTVSSTVTCVVVPRCWKTLPQYSPETGRPKPGREQRAPCLNSCAYSRRNGRCADACHMGAAPVEGRNSCGHRYIPAGVARLVDSVSFVVEVERPVVVEVVVGAHGPTGTSRSWWTTTPAGWSGPPPAGTVRPWPRSSPPWARSVARQSRTSPPTPRSGSLTRSRCTARTRSGAPTPFTSSRGPATLDQVRRDTWNAARKGGMSVHAQDLKGARYALWKNPENLTSRQQAKLAWVAKVNHQLFRAYLLKEQPREVFALKGAEGKQLLDSWLGWARRCRIPSFVELGRRISKHREAIDAALDHRLSNGLVESTNTKIRLLTRIAFGFKSPEAMITLAMLNLGGYCPPLPAVKPRESTHGTSRRAPNIRRMGHAGRGRLNIALPPGLIAPQHQPIGHRQRVPPTEPHPYHMVIVTKFGSTKL